MAKKEIPKPQPKRHDTRIPTTHKRSDVAGTKGTNRPGGRPTQGGSNDNKSN